MPFPSTLSSFNRSSPTDRLNSPSHSALHNTISSAVGQIEAVIGVEGSNSVVGTLEYFIKSPASNGGGHVQTAVLGGTGQITFTKGDILVAQSASVLSKLAVGVDNQVLVANSSVASGINWAIPTTTKVFNNASVITVKTTSETSVLSVVLPSSLLGTSGAVRATMYINATLNGQSSVVATALYGGGVVATSTFMNGGSNTISGIAGNMIFTLVANNSANLQRGILTTNLSNSHFNAGGNAVSSLVALYTSGTSSIASGTPNTMGITLTPTSSNSQIDIEAITVEKII